MKLYIITGPLENSPSLLQHLLLVGHGGGGLANEYVLNGGYPDGYIMQQGGGGSIFWEKVRTYFMEAP